MRLKQLCYKAISLLQRYNNLFLLLFGNNGKIVVFHEVSDKNIKNIDISCFISTTEFENFINKIGNNVCSLNDLLYSNRKGIVITFDDVPESACLNAIPLLIKREVPFVIYISPKFIGKEGYISEEQIIALSRCPLCTIGAHTMSHTKLRIKNDSFQDMLQSKLTLENITGTPVNHLAYPFGRADSVSRRIRREAKDAGFNSAVCTIPTGVPKCFDRWYIPRIAIW